VTTKKQIIKRIAKVRKEQNLTTTEAAKRAKISQPSWWRVETGNLEDPTYRILFQMLDALKIKWSIELSD
jgi:transcriptional regulator with XRE-family HTH domain